MRKFLIAAGVIAACAITAPASAYTESGYGSRAMQYVATPAAVVPAPVQQTVQQVQPVQQAQPAPAPTSAPAAAPAVPVVQAVAPVSPPDVPTAWPTAPVYNATCNATLDNYPCDWSSQHFGITLNGPEDNQWVDFFLKLEAGLADGTVILDPVTFEFKDQNGNVIW